MSDFPPPPPPIQPRPSLRSMRATESSSSASSHALDFSLDHHQNAGDNPVAATPNNIADELAHLNIVPIKPAAIYADYDDQKVFKKADEGKLDDRKWSRVIYTIVRGRAMPLKPLLLAFLWSVTAVTISYFTSRHYAPHLRNECRWWCTPLAIDGNALSYVGFALFLLTSFRVQEYV